MQLWIQLLGMSNTWLQQHDFDLGRFGAPTQKPICVYSPMNLDLEVPLDSYKRDSDYPPTAIVQLGQKFGTSVLFLLKDFLKEPMLISYTFFSCYKTL